ncbi:MAG TPA: hypothetical protein VIZ65_09845 [Cellvibrionaceae bacterium]
MKFTLFLLLALQISTAFASDLEGSCHGQTPLELNYCKLLTLGATGLPPLFEFRKNTPATQYLLLKRPAARLGIALAQPSKPKVQSASKGPTDSAEPVPSASTRLTTELKSSPRAKLPASQNTPGCELANEMIICGSLRYQLQWNKPKNALAAEALLASNQLIFPPLPPAQSAIDDYLLHCYALYIQKMLLLGLGNTTLSFGKFDAIFTEAKNQHFDFSARFTRMYHFLKEERKTLQPPKGFGHAKPQHIEDCVRISEQFWSCQTAEQHWVYAKI